MKLVSKGMDIISNKPIKVYKGEENIDLKSIVNNIETNGYQVAYVNISEMGELDLQDFGSKIYSSKELETEIDKLQEFKSNDKAYGYDIYLYDEKGREITIEIYKNGYSLISDDESLELTDLYQEPKNEMDKMIDEGKVEEIQKSSEFQKK